MAGRKEVGVKRGEMRGLFIVSNAGDMTDCGPRRPFTMGQLGSRGMDEGFRKQQEMVVSGPVR